MRVLNSRQLRNLPRVDQGNLYLDEVSPVEQAQRDKILRDRQKLMMVNDARAKAQRQEIYRQEMVRQKQSEAHNRMLQRSLKQDGHATMRAIQNQGKGFVPQFGVRAHQTGFVDCQDARQADFLAQDVYNAPQFNNHLTAKDRKSYSKYKDWPLVMDAAGDFGGYLLCEAGSPDFSTRIVNDARTDFGYVPQRRRKR